MPGLTIFNLRFDAAGMRNSTEVPYVPASVKENKPAEFFHNSPINDGIAVVPSKLTEYPYFPAGPLRFAFQFPLGDVVEVKNSLLLSVETPVGVNGVTLTLARTSDGIVNVPPEAVLIVPCKFPLL